VHEMLVTDSPFCFEIIISNSSVVRTTVSCSVLRLPFLSPSWPSGVSGEGVQVTARDPGERNRGESSPRNVGELGGKNCDWREEMGVERLCEVLSSWISIFSSG
jgi:hypothetical protein